MKKVAVLIDHGFEESELLITVDIMRRADINCQIVSYTDNNVQGTNNIIVQSDTKFQNTDIFDYDMIIIPSGFTHKESVLPILEYYNQHNKLIGLMGILYHSYMLNLLLIKNYFQKTIIYYSIKDTLQPTPLSIIV